MTQQERLDALAVVTSVIARCERLAPRFALGTSQHTLLRNRVQAMKIAKALLGGGDVARYDSRDLSSAIAPLCSVVGKCEKARSKHAPGSGQYDRYGGTIRAMVLSRELIEDELRRRTT